MWNIGARAWTRRRQGEEEITCPQGLEELTCTRGLEELTRLYASLDRTQVWGLEEVTHHAELRALYRAAGH